MCGTNVRVEADSVDRKVLHLHCPRNTADAATAGHLLRQILCIWTSFDNRISLLGSYHCLFLNYAAYFAEIFRSGIQSIPVGQYEAAKILGYSRFQTFLRIITPQMTKRVLPAVTNESITLVKDTSLAFAISYIELFTETQMIAASETSMLPYLAAAIFYYVFNLIVAGLMSLLEKRLNYYKI